MKKNRVNDKVARGQENLKNLRHLKESQYHKVLLEAGMVDLQSQVNDLVVQRDVLRSKAAHARGGSNRNYKELDLEFDNFELDAFDLNASQSCNKFGNDVSVIASSDDESENGMKADVDRNDQNQKRGTRRRNFFSPNIPNNSTSLGGDSRTCATSDSRYSETMFRDVSSIFSPTVPSICVSPEGEVDTDNGGELNSSTMKEMNTSVCSPFTPDLQISPLKNDENLSPTKSFQNIIQEKIENDVSPKKKLNNFSPKRISGNVPPKRNEFSNNLTPSKSSLTRRI